MSKSKRKQPRSFAGPRFFGTDLAKRESQICLMNAYDAAGNTTADPNGQTFVYDAENKQVSVSNSGGTIGQYFFDGDGRRVKKIVPATNETTIFVYDVAGQLVAEYSTQTSQTAGISYLTNDHLGSPRVITDATGTVTSRRDFHPYGEEVFTAQRTAGLGYTTDSTSQKFTGYERDCESGLDYAQARYYSSNLGRFFSIDPENADADTEVPQSWNAYAYARNNPLKYGDPTGEGVEVCSVSGESTCVYYSEPEWLKFLEANKKSGDFTIKGNKIFFGGELAAKITSSSFLHDRQKEFIESVAENTENKGRTVRIVAAAGGAAGVCIGTGGVGCPAAIRVASAIIESEVSTARENEVNVNVEPPGFGPGWVKMKGDQGYKDPDGNIWKKDMKHKDHWDVSDRRGNKVKEVDFNGRKIWPGGPKNRNKIRIR